MTMTDDVIVFLKSIDLFQLVIGLGILVYVSKFLVKTLFPALTKLNTFVDSLEGLEKIPKLEKDIAETKTKIVEMERQLKALVEGSLLPRVTDVAVRITEGEGETHV